MIQIGQTAVCNRHHSVDQQFCRWLLMSIDRLPDSDLAMTQELISNMLGVRREGVTEAAGKLQRVGAIRYQRGRITVLDRQKLQQLCCECYEGRPEGNTCACCLGIRPQPWSSAPPREFGSAGSTRRRCDICHASDPGMDRAGRVFLNILPAARYVPTTRGLSGSSTCATVQTGAAETFILGLKDLATEPHGCGHPPRVDGAPFGWGRLDADDMVYQRDVSAVRRRAV